MFEIITALAENFKTPLEFYQSMCKSMDDHDGDEENNGEDKVSKKRDHEENEVYLSTIHKAKGKEFQNVIYFNLSQGEHNIQKAQFTEEERRVTYVGATRAKDDLLITFSSAKPCDFLREISLNPTFQAFKNEELKQKYAACTRQLEKEQTLLKQMEARKSIFAAQFNELTKQPIHKGPNWLSMLLWKIQSRHLNKIQEKIARIEMQIKKHLETTINPLVDKLREIEEEGNIRTELGMKQ